MEVEEDVDDPMEIDDTIQTSRIIERRSDELTPVKNAASGSDANDDVSIVSVTKLPESTASKTADANFTPKSTSPIELSDENSQEKSDSATKSVSKEVSSQKTSKVAVKTNGLSNVSRKIAVEKSDDIVILDDDDDVPVEKSKRRSVDNMEVKEVIDLVEAPVTNKCINYSCKSGRDLMIAPGMCLSYYRVKCSATKVKEVCGECFDMAVQDYDKLVTELKNGKLLFDVDVPLRNDMVEIDDSDEETEVLKNEDCDFIDDESTTLICKEMDDVINKAMLKFNLEEHMQQEVSFLKQKSAKVTKDVKEIEEDCKAMRLTLDRIQINLYNQFRPEIRELKGLNIIDDRSISYPTIPVNRTTEARKVTMPSMQRSQAKPMTTTVPDFNRKQAAVGNVQKTITITPTVNNAATIAGSNEVPKDLPKVAPIEKPLLKIGETYYIMRMNGQGSWIRSRLVAINPPDPHTKNSTCTYKVMELKQLKDRVVTGKQIAYMSPSQVRLEVGTRVLAAFKEVTPVGETKKTRTNPYYPGIVAEPPVASNKYRYLIFFDIGYAQYVSYTMVNLILESSKNVWEDMSADSQGFIKKYLESPDRPMIKIAKDQTVRTEYNGKWWLCTVMNVDCSLVQVFFDALNRMEWIFRGSTRLSPIFREEQAASNRLNHVSRVVPRKLGTESATVVQYTRNSDFAVPTTTAAATTVPPPVRAVARKSTTKPQISIQPPANAVPFLPVQQNNTNNATSHVTGPTSKIMYFTPRDQVITKRPYRPHLCSPKCKEYLTHNFGKLRGHNPLSKPLLCGWARMTVKVRGRKEIVYKAPCGRMLRHLGDIHYYLTVTKSEMTVDLFDFNQMVRCLAEFSVECVPDPKDLSNGLEQVPIPVINGINTEILDFCNYSIERVPMQGVKMNLDPDFLCGCDCDDDCIDKTKCACWRLTLEGAKYVSKDVDPNSVGYIYRRLNDQVLTGIYECNSRCKCGSTCLNRVVQHPMSLKLQVFRTHNRGWGIRALNDVPQGAFICIYAGTIHTEQMANEDGMAYGDEYFAELDYIESVEKVKEDYESEVPPSDDEEEKPQRKRSPSLSDDDEAEVLPRTTSSRKRTAYADDNEFIPSNPFDRSELFTDTNVRRSLRKRTVDEKPREVEKEKEEKKSPPPEKMETDDGSNPTPEVKIKQEADNKESVDNLNIDTVTISDDEDEGREVLSFNPKTEPEEKKNKYVSVRELYGPDESVYVMDAKNAGNIGRFLNHSCSPNVFVQNVFVDTHDPRFPWVAFFTSQFVRAGTELVWNYNYDIGSVNGRVLYCHCASLECKGRLL